MTFSPSWYTTHPDEQKTTVSLDGVTLEQFDTFVKKASIGNQDRQADAIERVDGFAFQVANPWFLPTPSNIKVVDKWLRSKGIHHATFPEIAEAVEELAQAGLVSVDAAAYASHLDGNDAKTFRGAITQREYNSVDELISNERAAAIRQLGTEKQSDIERAFDRLSIEEQQQMLRDGVHKHQANADGQISQQNADSWLTLHPEFRDDTANGRLMLTQLKANGVTGVVTIEDYEVAERQLVSAGMIRQNPAALRKQQAQEVLARAKRAVETPGSVWDQTTEEEAYALPLDEIRRRANGNYKGF